MPSASAGQILDVACFFYCRRLTEAAITEVLKHLEGEPAQRALPEHLNFHQWKILRDAALESVPLHSHPQFSERRDRFRVVLKFGLRDLIVAEEFGYGTFRERWDWSEQLEADLNPHGMVRARLCGCGERCFERRMIELIHELKRFAAQKRNERVYERIIHGMEVRHKSVRITMSGGSEYRRGVSVLHAA